MLLRYPHSLFFFYIRIYMKRELAFAIDRSSNKKHEIIHRPLVVEQFLMYSKMKFRFQFLSVMNRFSPLLGS